MFPLDKHPRFLTRHKKGIQVIPQLEDKVF